MPKVSVIIPVYNVEQYLSQCLDSVVNQTLKDIEIICVNDGSTDGSAAIVKKYAGQDNRVYLYQKENGGLASTRNFGMKYAQGEYIYFLDSDDYITNDALEILYNEATTNNLDNIYFDAETFFETKELEQSQTVYAGYYNRKKEYSEIVTGLELVNRMVANNEYRCSCCLQFFRRGFLEENNLRYEEGIIHEDELFALEAVVFEKRVKHIKKTLYKRRVRDGSIMTGNTYLKHAVGLYYCITKFMERIQDVDFSRDERRILFERLRGFYGVFLNNVLEVPEFELDENLSSFPIKDELLFRLLSASFKNESIGLRNYISELENSRSYKIGRMVTFGPRLVRKCLKKCGSVRYMFSTFGRKIDKNKVCVSVVMPVYNAEKYLEECLASVVNQSLKNIEIICVNDGSTDSSLEILKRFATNDKRVKVIDKENTGAGDCRNIGMREAKGEYLLFLDADDVFDKDLCFEMYRRAAIDNADICFVGADRLNMKMQRKEYMGWVLNARLLPKKTPFKKENIQNGEKYFQISSACPWSKLFRRKFIFENKIEFQNLKNSNDVYFVRVAMALAKRLTCVDKRLILYRYAEGSNTQSGKHRYPLEFYKAFKAVKERLVAEGCYAPLEKSFANMVMNDTLFNYNTTTTQEAKETIRSQMVNEGVEFFGFNKYPQGYFFDEMKWKEFNELLGDKMMESQKNCKIYRQCVADICVLGGGGGGK